MHLGVSTQIADDASVSTSSISSGSTLDTFISCKPTSHTPAFANSKYHFFPESLHVMHSIRNMKGTAGVETAQALSIWSSKLHSILFQPIHGVLIFERTRFHEIDLQPYSSRYGISARAGLTSWAHSLRGKRQLKRKKLSALSLPRARGNGDRIFYLFMLVTLKPHQTLWGGVVPLSLCFEIGCNSGDDWTNEENMTYLSRPKPVMCLNLLGRPPPKLRVLKDHCLPDAWSGR